MIDEPIRYPQGKKTDAGDPLRGKEFRHRTSETPYHNVVLERDKARDAQCDSPKEVTVKGLDEPHVDNLGRDPLV